MILNMWSCVVLDALLQFRDTTQTELYFMSSLHSFIKEFFFFSLACYISKYSC